MSDPAALSRAQVLIELDRDAEARELLGSMLAGDPEDPDALCLMAQACLGEQDFRSAWEAAAAAVRLAPDHEWPHRLLSIAMARCGRAAEAQERALVAVRCDPFEWRTHLNAAQLGLITGRVGQHSLLAAQEALRLAPHESEAHRVYGALMISTGSPGLAEAPLREALRLDPQNQAARNDLARVDLSRRRLGSAARGFADAAALDPTDTIAANNLAVVVARALRIVHLLLWVVFFTAGRYAVSDGPYRRTTLAVGLAVTVGVLAFLAHRTASQAGGRVARLGRIVLRRDRTLAVWAGCLVIAFAALVAVTAVGTDAGDVLIGVAAVALLLGAVLTWVFRWRANRR